MVVAFLVRERGEVRLEGETSLSNKTNGDDVAPIILDIFIYYFNLASLSSLTQLIEIEDQLCHQK